MPHAASHPFLDTSASFGSPPIPTERFPGLHRDWVRLDGPAGTQTLDVVADAMFGYLVDGRNANTEGFFAASEYTDAMLARTRQAIGRFYGADPEGVVFGTNMTSLNFAFTRTVGRTLRPGDEIICTTLDHEANVAPWLAIAEETGAQVRFATFEPDTGRLPTEQVTRLLTDRTRWIAVTGASNVLGTMPDVAAITTAAHDAGARVLVDAVHLTPHRPIDVAALGCDVLLSSAYKWYGPHIGVLWGRPELLADLRPYHVGDHADPEPAHWQVGTPPLEAIAGLAAAAEFLLEVGMADIVRYEQRVFATLLAGLRDLPRVSVVGPDDHLDRAPTVTFTIAGQKPDDVARFLADRHIAVWSGDFYAPRAISALGLGDAGGAVRAGVSCYTTEDDVATFLTAISTLC
ncbi:cysteine desulfurase-like protein [Longimycelium tulufanense]|uniref:Cysteine desulfurase-like protein n=1 Tax=Longimycelium tulufanense TaxID=907463 RepID=A0A8J3CD49_9PSEU|nr:cysteine desulfurase-like protein [Longimycelium tulufanense]GGM48701.1 cysteine desulfurase-like protein [Longimycelium tulufanense]